MLNFCEPQGKDKNFQEQCHQLATCHHKTLMCDYDASDVSTLSKFKCVNRQNLCDGVAQCVDKFDESEKICDFVSQHVCPTNTYPCPYDRSCLNNTKVCDGKHDCDLTSDYFNVSVLNVIPLPHSDEYSVFCEGKFLNIKI